MAADHGFLPAAAAAAAAASTCCCSHAFASKCLSIAAALSSSSSNNNNSSKCGPPQRSAARSLACSKLQFQGQHMPPQLRQQPQPQPRCQPYGFFYRRQHCASCELEHFAASEARGHNIAAGGGDQLAKAISGYYRFRIPFRRIGIGDCARLQLGYLRYWDLDLPVHLCVDKRSSGGCATAPPPRTRLLLARGWWARKAARGCPSSVCRGSLGGSCRLAPPLCSTDPAPPIPPFPTETATHRALGPFLLFPSPLLLGLQRVGRDPPPSSARLGLRARVRPRATARAHAGRCDGRGEGARGPGAGHYGAVTPEFHQMPGIDE